MAKRPSNSKERRRAITESFSTRVGKREALKIRARMDKDQTIWFGLGVFGVVGWSVAIPTLIGVAFGLWIDQTWPSRFSWALMLLIGGVLLGSLNAWYWVKKAGISRDDE